MARKSTVVYLYTEKKIRLIERGVCFLERSQYQRFLQFERLYIFITLRQTKCIFVTTKVKGLISHNIREINSLIQNHWSVFTQTGF